MNQSQSSWTRRIFGINYKWVSTLTTILILGLVLYFLLPQIFPVALQPEEQSSAYVSARGMILQEDFTNSNSGWPSESQANAAFGYESPTFYYLEVRGPNDRLAVSPGLNLVNFTAETKATVNYTDTPNGNFRYGLIVRRLGENYYAFTISPRSGTWQVLKYTPNEVKVLAENNQAWLRSTFRLFTLSASARDKKLSFQINNQPVIEITDPDYISGDVGFIVETFDETLVHVTFDSLKVQKIQDQPAVAVAPSETSIPTALPMSTAASSISATLTASPVSTATLITSTSTPDVTLNDALPSLTPTVAPTTELMPPLQTPSPWPTSSPLPPATPLLPTPTPSPTSTSMPVSLTPTLNPTPTSGSVPTISPVPTTSTPSSSPTASATPASGISTGAFVLLAPLDLERPSFGPTNFEWEWTGAVPPGFGFEVRVWREGEPVAGVHNAVLDNQNGNVKSIGENKYSLNVDIRDAAGVRGRKGQYLWTVALVQISPSYADVGKQAEPARLRFETPGGNDKSSDEGGGGGGGGVGIQ